MAWVKCGFENRLSLKKGEQGLTKEKNVFFNLFTVMIYMLGSRLFLVKWITVIPYRICTEK